MKNESSGIEAKWIYELGMSEDSMWNVFDNPTLGEPILKALPILATDNLQVA